MNVVPERPILLCGMPICLSCRSVCLCSSPQLPATLNQTVPGLWRQLPDPPCGPRPQDPAARQAAFPGQTAAFVASGALRQPMGGGLCKYSG